MKFVPEEIVREIVRRVGKGGFRELAGFIRRGKQGKKLAYDNSVLVEVDVDEFIFATSHANEESMYRHFFVKCFEAGNITACYVEGLWVAVKYGPSDAALELMKSAEEFIIYAKFAAGVFSICGGRFEEGIRRLRVMYEEVYFLPEVVEIGEAVMRQIAEIGPDMAGKYNGTYNYTQFDIPECVYYCCSMTDVCFDCLAYWYSIRVWDIC